MRNVDDGTKTRTASKGFYQVVQEGQEALTPWDLHRLFLKQDGVEDIDAARDEQQVDAIGEAVSAFNEATQPFGDGGRGGADLGLHGYATLLQMDEETLKCIISDPAHCETLGRVRACLQAADNLQKMLLELDAVETQEHDGCEERTSGGLATLVDRWLDPFIGFVITLNALLIGFSVDVDPEWVGWVAIEACFTFVFCVEVALKISIAGPTDHFLGRDWAWNLFDAAILLLALADHLAELLVRSLHDEGIDLQAVTALRLLRFLRVSKLARVLRLKIFKELNLLVTGFMAGLKTLLFAIVFLFFVVYCLGVMIRMTIGTQTLLCEQDGVCTDRSDAHFIMWRGELFGSVAKAMFTCFRCFTDGCVSLDGTPLIPYVWNVFGPFAMVIYVFSTLVVIFGLFNLIAAIFVENTLENSKLDDEKRQALLIREHVRTAYRLQQCITKIALDMDRDGNLHGRSAHLRPPKPAAGLLRFFSTSQPVGAAQEGLQSARTVSITPKMLHTLLQCREVQLLIEEMGVNLAACDLLYDVLDSDGNGSLDVCEVVQGIVKLRGELKFDSVETILTVRALQKTMRNVEMVAMSQQKAFLHLRRHQENLERLALPAGLRSALSVDQQQDILNEQEHRWV